MAQQSDQRLAGGRQQTGQPADDIFIVGKGYDAAVRKSEISGGKRFVGLYGLQQQIITGGVARAGVGAAVTFIMMIVPLVLFIVAQSNVMRTMANSGIKE